MTQTLTAVIVDDEKHCRDFLQHSLGEHCPHVEVLASCETFEQTMQAIRTHAPQLVFMDVEMPEGSGFELLEELDDIDFCVVFTTAHPHYAIRAIRVDAIDYLLKPVQPAELKAAIARVEEAVDLRRSQPGLFSGKKETVFQKIALPSTNGLIFCHPDEIVRCEADGAYTRIYIVSGNLLVSKNIKVLEDILAPFSFFRVHKSHLINLKHLREYIKGNGGIAVMSDNSQVEVSKRKREEFLDKLI
jgi:two-component system LytT family response regulator